MDLTTIISLSLSSVCTFLLALYSLYYVFFETDSKRFHYKIAFPSMLSIIMNITIRILIIEIHGSTINNYQASLLVYIENLVSCIAANLIILSAVALGLPIWISLMKSFLMNGSNGAGLLSLMVIFAEKKGQKAIYIFMILATVIFSASTALLPRVFLADILLIYSFMATITLAIIPLLPTTYYLIVLLIKCQKEEKDRKSEIPQFRKEAAKLASSLVATVAIGILWFPIYGLTYINKPFEDKSDLWYSESKPLQSDYYLIAIDWILITAGFFICFIFRDAPRSWLKQLRPMSNTATMGTRTRNFLSIATRGKDGTLSSAVLKA